MEVAGSSVSIRFEPECRIRSSLASRPLFYARRLVPFVPGHEVVTRMLTINPGMYDVQRRLDHDHKGQLGQSTSHQARGSISRRAHRGHGELATASAAR